jgi:hypothetical protein
VYSDMFYCVGTCKLVDLKDYWLHDLGVALLELKALQGNSKVKINYWVTYEQIYESIVWL